MLRYSFKGFFQDKSRASRVDVYHNDEWVSNAHFVCKKDILLKSQRNFIDEHKKTELMIDDVLDNIINKEIDRFNKINKDERVFTPTHINTYPDKTENIVYDEVLEVSIKEKYYNYFTRRNCVIYKGQDDKNPLIIARNGEFIGILLPCRVGQKLVNQSIPITDYYTQL